MKIEYKGRTITDEISVNTCIHDMYAEGRADTLYLRMNDVEGKWDTWAPKIGDEIKVSEGAISTGTMYLRECVALNGLYTLKATALPPTYRNTNSKAWQQVRLLQIGQEIAHRHGLKFKHYGVSDHTYRYIPQANQDDFSFLSSRCALEGCALIVHDKTLIIYSQTYMERQQVDEFLDLSMDVTFDYRDKRAKQYGTCEVSGGRFSGKYSVSNGSKTILRSNSGIYVSSNAEAQRFAKNLLREANKNSLVGNIHGDILTGYAAGSMATIKNAKAPAWNGPVFLTHVRNDYGKYRNKIFFRKPLEGY